MTARLKWEKGCSIVKEELKDDDTMSMPVKWVEWGLGPTRYSVHWNMSLDRKVIGHKIRTIKPMYEMNW